MHRELYADTALRVAVVWLVVWRARCDAEPDAEAVRSGSALLAAAHGASHSITDRIAAYL
jgi:hypothetical protein